MHDGPRILVLGTSGSGKSTLARAAAQRLGVGHIELDAAFHGPDWTPMDEGLFRQKVSAFTTEAAWVIDGNYGMVRDIILARATTVVWLDPPRWRVMWQVITRSAKRVIFQEKLWNDNRERLSAWLDPEHPIRWAWSTHHPRRRQFLKESEGDSRWLRLRTRREAADWLVRLADA
ncbi:MAG: adenylate kinase [Planctomycetota bacterium]